MNQVNHRQFVWLVGSIARLGWEAENQIEYLTRLGVSGSADELALEFDDAVVNAESFERQGWLNPAESQALEGLSRQLTMMSGEDNSQLWTFDALRSAPEWAGVRVRAREFFAPPSPHR